MSGKFLDNLADFHMKFLLFSCIPKYDYRFFAVYFIHSPIAEKTMIQKYLHPYFQPSFPQGKLPRLLSVSYSPASFNKEHPRILHRHPDAFELLLVTQGSGMYYLDTSYHAIQKGDLIFCNSDVLHDELAEKNHGLSFYSLRITGFIFQNLPENHLIPESMNPILPLKAEYRTFRALFEELYRYADPARHLEEFCEHLSQALIVLAISLRYAESALPPKVLPGKTASAEWLYQVKHYIDAHYHDELSLEQLASAFHLSPYHLSHAFKAAYALSPIQYLCRRRIGEAQSLLTTTAASITEISGAVGFSDSNYFTAQFKKYVKMSPSEYRKVYAV